MTKPYSVLMGKTVRYIARLRGGGSALPGLFVEKIDRHFVRDTLAQLHYGVVLVSGTNGKTTTTKMVVELLESQGLKVFTNRTGSNFSRGVAAALLGEVDRRGRLYADIAVLELDEAHAVHFVDQIPPKYSLLLNVMRDQLDRFGEIDATARMLAHIATATKEAVVINREDPRLLKIAGELKGKQVKFFGLDTGLRDTFPSDDDLHGSSATHVKLPLADVLLSKLGESNQEATFTVDGKTVKTTLKLQGIYNVYNAAAALALTRAVMDGQIHEQKLFECLSLITPAFGRGEQLVVGGQPCELVLVKNPGGFRLGLQSFDPKGYATMIAINDNYADGRDMSWLWDVDFTSLQAESVARVSGIRAYDMALRLQYDEVSVGSVDTDLVKSLRHFIADYPDMPKRIYCTYTAMLALRRELGKITNVEKVS